MSLVTAEGCEVEEHCLPSTAKCQSHRVGVAGPGRAQVRTCQQVQDLWHWIPPVSPVVGAGTSHPHVVRVQSHTLHSVTGRMAG